MGPCKCGPLLEEILATPLLPRARVANVTPVIRSQKPRSLACRLHVTAAIYVMDTMNAVGVTHAIRTVRYTVGDCKTVGTAACLRKRQPVIWPCLLPTGALSSHSYHLSQ